MGPEPCQNQRDARNTSPIPVQFLHNMACSYLFNFGHHRLVNISGATADGTSQLIIIPLLLHSPVEVVQDISGAQLKTNGAPGNIQGNLTDLITMSAYSIQYIVIEHLDMACMYLVRQ